MNEKGKRLPDLASLRIDPNLRAAQRLKKPAVLITSIIGLLIIAVVVAFVIKNQKVSVEVAIARPASESWGAVVLNASGYITPRRRS